jgi:anaerobic glycerol-3-phosphate dehydrogenase
MKKFKRWIVLGLVIAGFATYATGCGSGVEFGAKKFTLNGAGS